ncbi:hypothetical protein EVAR_29423_1 [Eumeta japonica]|uniref:Uncharacterized protein n=1 Tax=Eumeta variegata TaxID=151549 RepID=A0A4C1VSH7_EUMVA|nr:hypothetical protein EVAR_29423_1 [Eumeta japonica]
MHTVRFRLQLHLTNCRNPLCMDDCTVVMWAILQFHPRTSSEAASNRMCTSWRSFTKMQRRFAIDFGGPAQTAVTTRRATERRRNCSAIKIISRPDGWQLFV